jgi:hypothetical protein
VQPPEISIAPIETSSLTGEEQLLAIYGAGFLAFTVTDSAGQVLVFEKHALPATVPNALEQCLQNNPWLQQKYKQVKTAYFTPDTVTLPSALYDPATAGEHITLLYGPNDHKVMLHDYTGAFNTYQVYRVEKAALKQWLRQYPLAASWHVQSLLMNANKGKKDGIRMQADFLQNGYAVVLLRDGQLLASKTYACQHHADAVFLLLALCELHGITPDAVQLSVSGWLMQDSPLFTELRKYFQHCNFADTGMHKVSELYPGHFFAVWEWLYRT